MGRVLSRQEDGYITSTLTPHGPHNNHLLSAATIGVSAYAAKALGDVVFVELPTVDAEIVAGDSFGAVESVKSASELYVPVSGRVTEANRALEEKPSMMNKDPEGEAWIARISVAEDTGTATEELMDEAAYREFTDTETA